MSDTVMSNNAHRWSLQSPDQRIEAAVQLSDKGELSYAVNYNNTVVLKDASLGIQTSTADFTSNLVYLSHNHASFHESYTLSTGKRTACSNEGNELLLRFRKKNQTFALVFRVYNDGIAYRYQFDGNGSIGIIKEISAFCAAGITAAWAQDLVPHYEGFYEYRTPEQLKGGKYGMPLLLSISQNNWVLLSEAAVYGNYCGSHLEGTPQEPEVLRVTFAPDQLNEVKSSLPLHTPWRVAIIGSTLSSIVESTLIENLNPVSEITDTSWIKPGRSAWSWWSGDSTEEFATQKKYVDFAASLGWEYYLCDAGWQESWLEEIVAYAAEKNVGIFLWSHYKDLATEDEILDKLPRWAKAGVKGIKVDFFESDCQDRIEIYDKLARVAAANNLMVNYHGATKPSGERRRWPHLMTREGILGAEYYKWSEGATAEHNCTVPFTRNVVGPMDYTPVTYSDMKGQTTWAHQTALAVVFESGIQHLADRPEAYAEIGEAINFLKECPASWDETKLLDGYPGRYVTIARRKDSRWFIGSLCGGNTAKEVSIPLTFLDPTAVYEAVLYKDGSSIEEIIIEKAVVKQGDTLNIKLNTNGGCAIYVHMLS